MSESEWIWGEDRAQQHLEEHYPVDSSYYDSGIDLTPIKRIFAGVAAVMFGVLSGLAQSDSAMVVSVQTPSGEAMMFNQPDPRSGGGSAFLASLSC